MRLCRNPGRCPRMRAKTQKTSQTCVERLYSSRTEHPPPFTAMLNRIIPLLVLLLAIVTSEVGSRTVDRSYRGVGSQHPSPWTPALLASPETHTRDICLPVAKLFTSSVYPPWYMSVAVEKCEVTDISQNVPAQKDDEHCPFDGPELHDALALTPSVRFGTPGPYPVLRRSSVLLSLEPRPKPSQTKAVVGAILGLGKSFLAESAALGLQPGTWKALLHSVQSSSDISRSRPP